MFLDKSTTAFTTHHFLHEVLHILWELGGQLGLEFKLDLFPFRLLLPHLSLHQSVLAWFVLKPEANKNRNSQITPPWKILSKIAYVTDSTANMPRAPL